MLKDLQSFARKNDLPALAAQVETTLQVAEAEIAALGGHGTPEEGDDGPAPEGRGH
ncbi:MAG TPA: hypothetical protein VGA75_04865 [Paracoccaceae bacterium]